ncbi:MAG: hypothetical protein HUU57_15430 [Bdellovibrio sp.]|nr:hypothetical protein [Bdellovibrio sp.]
MTKSIFAIILASGVLAHTKPSEKSTKPEEKRSPDYSREDLSKGVKPEVFSVFAVTGCMATVNKIYDNTNRTTCYIVGTTGISCVKE